MAKPVHWGFSKTVRLRPLQVDGNALQDRWLRVCLENLHRLYGIGTTNAEGREAKAVLKHMRISITHSQRRGRRAGVTLIEALVSLAVFGVSFTSLYGGISMGFATIGNARENLRATQIMVEKMETIRLFTFKQINTPGFIPATFTDSFYPASSDDDLQSDTNRGLVYNGTLTISDGPTDRAYNSYLKRVTISVSWRTGERTHNRSMSTLVARHGLQNYVY